MEYAECEALIRKLIAERDVKTLCGIAIAIAAHPKARREISQETQALLTGTLATEHPLTAIFVMNDAFGYGVTSTDEELTKLIQLFVKLFEKSS